MKKKSLVALSIISCLTAASVLSACNTSSPVADKGEESSTAKDGEGVTIQFWNSFTGTDGDVLREIVEKYNKENDKGVTIEMDIMPADIYHSQKYNDDLCQHSHRYSHKG